MEKPKNTPNKDSGRRTLLILAGIALMSCLMIALCVGGFVYVIIRATQPVADVGSEFLRAVTAEDYTTAYALLDTERQAQYESEDGLRLEMEERNVQPQSWRFTSRSVDANGTAEISGRVRMANGASRTVYMDLRWLEGLQAWQISAVTFD
jgi:hypothetical protein